MPSNYAPPICPKHAIRLKTLIDTIDGFEKNRAINEQLLGVKVDVEEQAAVQWGLHNFSAAHSWLQARHIMVTRTRPGYQSVVFFFLLARFTRSGLGQATRPSSSSSFLPGSPGPGHQSSCFYKVQATSLLASFFSVDPRRLTVGSTGVLDYIPQSANDMRD